MRAVKNKSGGPKHRKAAGSAPPRPSQTRLRAEIGTLQRRLSALHVEADGGARRLVGDAARFLGAALARLQEADEILVRSTAVAGAIAPAPQRREEPRPRSTTASREGEALFANAFRHAMTGMAIVDLSGRPLKVNDALCRLLGYSEEELCRGTAFDFTHRDDVAASHALVDRLLSGDVSAHLEKRYRRKDGSILWGRLSLSLIRADDGQPLHLVAQVEDITQRRRVTQALQKSEERFALAVAGAHDGIWDWHFDSNALYASARMAAILGFRAEEIDATPRALLASVHPDDRGRLEADFRAHTDGNTPQFVGEYRMRHRDGSYRWVLARGLAVRGPDGLARRMAGSLTDITQRKEAEQALREGEQALRASEAKNKAILDASPDTFIRIRGDGTLLDVKGDTSSWRTAPEHAVGRNLTELMPLAMATPALETVARAVTTGQMQTYEFETPTAQGVLCLEARIVACGEDEALCSLRDITARRRAEQEARQRLTELAHVARVSTMGEMAATLAHELNQPLMAIVGFASGCALRVESGTIEPPELQGALRHVSQQAVRAGEILRRLRDFVRKGRPQRSQVNVNDLAREVAGLADVEARGYAVTLRLELDATIPAVDGDPIQIEQVMLNLIRNGIEAMSEAAEPRVLTLRTSCPSADAVAITVIDRGKGLPPGAESLFEPFVSTKPKGLGLGLSISRSIVEAHGGRLSGWSDGQSSTTFQFTLPVAWGGTR